MLVAYYLAMTQKSKYNYLRAILSKGKVKKVVVANAFSLSMLKSSAIISARDITPELDESIKVLQRYYLLKKIEVYSIVGHPSTAKVLSELLGIEITPNRVTYKLEEKDALLVMQIMERLPPQTELGLEDLKRLLSEGKVKFFVVTVRYY